MSERKEEGGGRLGAGGWVLLVLGLGVALGVLLAAIPLPDVDPRPPFRFERFEDVAVVLSTVAVALLVALLVVYIRTYRDTQANFALGLVLVRIALLVQSVLTSPVLLGAFGHRLGGLGPFFFFAEAFKAAAFSLFLYLSLQ